MVVDQEKQTYDWAFAKEMEKTNLNLMNPKENNDGDDGGGDDDVDVYACDILWMSFCA